MFRHEQDPLPLNVLTSKFCDRSCPFCVENTIRRPCGWLEWQFFADIINRLVDTGTAKDPSLLGGEPLYYNGILELIQAIKVPSIVTTNGQRLVKQPTFLSKFQDVAGKLRALNISLPHYDQSKRAELSGTGRSFSNEELKSAIAQLSGVNIRVNTLLMKGYVDSLDEIRKMIDFTRDMGIHELKIGELTGRDSSIHDHINPLTVRFNADHYLPIPIEECYQECHTGDSATTFWETVDEVDVFFNAPQDELMRGGKDKNGKFYQLILFEDGYVGPSWNRERDGAFPPF